MNAIIDIVKMGYFANRERGDWLDHIGVKKDKPGVKPFYIPKAHRANLVSRYRSLKYGHRQVFFDELARKYGKCEATVKNEFFRILRTGDYE